MGSLLKLVQIPLGGMPSFLCISCTTQLCGIRKLAESALDPIGNDIFVYVIDKDIKKQGVPIQPP